MLNCTGTKELAKSHNPRNITSNDTDTVVATDALHDVQQQQQQRQLQQEEQERHTEVPQGLEQTPASKQKVRGRPKSFSAAVSTPPLAPSPAEGRPSPARRGRRRSSAGRGAASAAAVEAAAAEEGGAVVTPPPPPRMRPEEEEGEGSIAQRVRARSRRSGGHRGA